MGAAACAVVDRICAAFDRTWPRPNLPAHVRSAGTEDSEAGRAGAGGAASAELLDCFAAQLDCRRLSHTTLSARRAGEEEVGAVDTVKLCGMLRERGGGGAPAGRPRVGPSHRVVIVPTLPPTGDMRDPVFVLDFCRPFCAPSFGGGCDRSISVSASGAAVLYRVVARVGGGATPRSRTDNATDWRIDTVWAGRDGAGFGTGIAMNSHATADELRCSALWAYVVQMLRDEPIGLPRSAAAKGAHGPMAWCCWVDLERSAARGVAGRGLQGGDRDARGSGGRAPPPLDGTTWEETGRPRPP